MIDLSHARWQDYLALAFAVFVLIYLLVWWVRDSKTTRERVTGTAGIIVFSPILLVIFLGVGYYIWPLLAIGIGGMLIWPFTLLTRGGRDHAAYVLRRGRWRNRP